MINKDLKRSILNILTTAVVLTGMPACADLDLPSDGRLTIETVFSEYYRVRNYHDRCRDYIITPGFNNGGALLASYSDEAHDAADGVSSSPNNWYNNRTSVFSNPVGDVWQHYFEGIRKCNSFLTYINDPEIFTAAIEADELSGWIGEVYTLRGFYYLQLIKRYGGVPIMDKPYEIGYDFTQDRRASFEECVDFIMASCDSALALPISSRSTVGFRWDLSDNENGTITRAFAWAVKSQAALYAASPLWYASGSKYDWNKALEITKEALDECYAHGFRLFNITPSSDIARSAYDYYCCVVTSDASRAVDKETIYGAGSRSNVWINAGTPVTEGQNAAGAGPSQELVDSYEMQSTGVPPILGYADADHLIPIYNPLATDYDPANPYEGRDPRFYASIYYNNSDRALLGKNDTLGKITMGYRTPPSPGDNPSRCTVTVNADGSITATSTGADAYYYFTNIGKPIVKAVKRVVSFDYQCDGNVWDAEFFFCVRGGPEGGRSTGQNMTIVKTEPGEWIHFEHEIGGNVDGDYGFGNADMTVAGSEPVEQHFLRFDFVNNQIGVTLTIKSPMIVSYTPPPPIVSVETFVGGNCGISDRVTDTRYTRTGYYLRKFNNYKSAVGVSVDPIIRLYRMGELYLNFAEAAYNAGSPSTVVPAKVAGGLSLSAIDAVDSLRLRAQMPKLPAGLSKSDFEARYRNERRVELAFEEHRFFDVRRWKILSQTDNFVTGMKITKNSSNTFDYTRIKLKERGTNTDKYLMFPIMQSEVLKMQEYTGESWQNPGWN
ncbi:MAG: RagB/SusD family nutrient uptake outer membrane protein [Bacteroidales bacterium]|jgi:hypothetical protein|nr:RagB/SusD family nutrient uptake outer membrane protein [Bacteroidales bacterium]